MGDDATDATRAVTRLIVSGGRNWCSTLTPLATAVGLVIRLQTDISVATVGNSVSRLKNAMFFVIEAMWLWANLVIACPVIVI